MCKGATEESLYRPSAFAVACAATRSCELCESRAVLYCQADDAYLCRKCDQTVHGANFLAQRHVRCFLCVTCQKLTQRYRVRVSSDFVLPNLVVSEETSGYDDDSDDSTNSSRMIKRPFLFF